MTDTVDEAREALLDARLGGRIVAADEYTARVDALIAAVRAEEGRWNQTAMRLDNELSTERAKLRALREAAQTALTTFDEHGGFTIEEWPEFMVLRAALAATPAEEERT